jgi:large conductance mechanosensitive channel
VLPELGWTLRGGVATLEQGAGAPSQRGDTLFKEFREFAMRGNVVDLAVGIIIGAAFGAIVNSLVNDIIMPIIGYVTGGMDFKDLAYVLKPASTGPDGAEIPAVEIRYGLFINLIINFVIVAFALFILVKAMNQMKRKQEAAPTPPPETPADVKLLTEIRDLLSRRP